MKLGLQQMQSTTASHTFQIDPTTIAPTLTYLAGNVSVNVTGALGSLPFDGKGDITTADVQIWCVPPATAGSDIGGPAINSGLYFDSTTGMTKG